MTSPGQRYDSLFMTFAEWDRSPSGHWVMRRHTFLDWKVLKAQAIAASSLNPRAVSAAGAKGLFQFMDPTWQEWSARKQPGAPLDVWNPEHATFLAAAYLEWMLRRVGGDLRKAIAAYNWGIGHVTRVVQERGEQWEAALPLETSGYLARVLGA